MFFGRSDISDERGYTSYLDRYGILRLPSLVLFRNGHPSLMPYDDMEPLHEAYEPVVDWMEGVLAGEKRRRLKDTIFEPIGGSIEQNLEVEKYHKRIRDKQLAAEAAAKKAAEGPDGVAAIMDDGQKHRLLREEGADGAKGGGEEEVEGDGKPQRKVRVCVVVVARCVACCAHRQPHTHRPLSHTGVCRDRRGGQAVRLRQAGRDLRQARPARRPLPGARVRRDHRGRRL